MSLFQAASKQAVKAKILLDGSSGSGKTHGMLRLLRGFGGKIAVIDSENHSVEKKPAELLSGIDIANIEERTIENYVRHIKDAEAAGYTALGIDSLTHPWQELLEEIDHLAKTKFAGNSFRAWSEGTPKQRKLVDAILFSKMHIVATGRVKTDWVIEQNDKGKATPRKVGLQTEQGKGLEYEFDLWLRIQEGLATVLKDRFAAGLQGKIIDKLDEEFGKNILTIVGQGDDSEIKIASLFEQLGLDAKQRQAARDKYPDKAVLLEKLQGFAAQKAVV